jgi:hypothetical protein
VLGYPPACKPLKAIDRIRRPPRRHSDRKLPPPTIPASPLPQ